MPSVRKAIGSWRKGTRTSIARAAAEKAIGKPLSGGAVIHHANGNPSDDTHSNLVVCPNEAYHQLLHTRTAALEACGNANYKKCTYCKQYDSPERLMEKKSLDRPNPRYHHRDCLNKYQNDSYYRRTGRTPS